jgi:cholera toxin transcriptional activator
VPVAGQGKNQNQDGDDQQPRGFQRIHVGLGVPFRRRFQLRLWLGSGHGPIVTPNTGTRGSEPALYGSRFSRMLNYASCPMPTPQASPAGRILRFGVFEVDLAAGELRKGGIRIRLQEQPFQVLAFLLERPGDVVTREELRQKLWPADTFVDFDHSLNTAVNKLREALGDSASSPRYVETLARRGYRFLAPIDRPVAINPPVETQQAASPPPAEPVVLHPDLDVPPPHRGLTRGLFALIQLMYLIFYLVALFRLQEVDRITDTFLPGWGSFAIVAGVIVTGGVGIIVRCYLMSAVGFDYRRLREKFERLFLLILPLDQLWAVAPFLLVQKIGFGAAFAATAGLLYVPFSERTLVRMAYPGKAEPRG